MPIENNLPVIFDCATQTEDGLMAYQDKIKLDGMSSELSDKISKTDKIKSSQLDTSSDAAKIQPGNLSDAVKKMMTGQSSVEATVPNNGVTNEKLAANAVTIDKTDKRMLLGNIVSPRPLNFVFDTKKVSITVPKGSLFLTDATTSRILATGSDIEDKVVNINYPTEFTGLNYIVSAPNGTLSMVNIKKVSTITNTNSIMALVSLSNTFEATVVMNGNYTINGLAQGIGTESAALLGIGKVVFDKTTGIIDFTEAGDLYLVSGGVYKLAIQNQASIRLANYSDDVTYILYWDNTTSSLKTAVSNVITDTDINKIAMIKDGRIIPFVNTGIFYSKPYIEAPYYTETFDFINNINLISKNPINILREEENKLEFLSETYVCLNEQNLLVKNTECYYSDREGLHYILFDLDKQTLSCRYSKETETSAKDVVVGTMWITNGQFPQITGNFTYTVDGKTVYQDDLKEADSAIKDLQDITNSDLANNKILCANELFMVDGDELPIYSSSMLLKETEGVKPAVVYNKKNSSITPITEFINGNKMLNSANIGNTIKLMAADKYEDHSYLMQSVKVNKVVSTVKDGQPIKVLFLGDDLVNDAAYHVKNKLANFGVVPTMIGTMVNGQVYGEGRDGWFYSTFIGASGRGQNEGKITPQTAQGASSILLNPFLRVANADDKANKPNDCYRATGAYTEKNYYNDTDKSGAFYIFDFAKYMEVQGIETPDVVIIAVKPELVQTFTQDVIGTNMNYLKQLVSGIKSALPDTIIGLVPQYGISTVYPETWELTHRMIEETVTYVNGLKDENIKVIPSWIHMCREFGTAGFTQDLTNKQLYTKVKDPLDNTLSNNAKLELANSIAAFIMNI